MFFINKAYRPNAHLLDTQMILLFLLLLLLLLFIIII